MRRFDRFTHFEAGKHHGYLRSGVLLLLVLVVCLLCAPSGAIAAEGSIEKDLQADLGRSRDLVENIEAKLAKGAAIGPDLGQLKTVAENIRITDLLMEERFKLREEKVKSLGAKAVDRHEAMVKGYRKALTEYLALIDKLPSDGTIKQSTADKLQSLLNKLLPKKHRPIIGSLPYKHLNYPAIEPSTAPAITPAYRGGNRIVSPDDTKSTPEAPLSKELAELAQSLNWQPVAEYEYVKNSIETEWYWGCQKGAEETLRQKSGNDCDQALLLSSLLKASGFPTRLVRGNIQFFASDDKPIERIRNLIGIDDPAKMAEFFQKAGIPYKPIIAGGKIANFEISHIYVESQIPYANYRGIVIDEHGKTWLGLDTAIKNTDYVYNNPQDLFEQPGLGDRLTGLRDEYLALDLNSESTTTQPATPLEYLQSSINSELQTQNSQLAYADFQRTRILIPEVMKILPNSMQFSLIKATNEYTSIPDELLHKVRFTATNPQLAMSSLFDITLSLYKLSNQQIAITYEPETVEDQEIIDSYGGLDNTPSYLVRLRPALKINGERIIVATDGLPMGADYTLTMDLYSPSVNEGATPAETINNTMITGNLSAIGITAQKAVTALSPPAGEGGGEGEKDAERLLYESAQHYIDRENQAEDELASLFHFSIARPLPTVVTLAGVIDVTYLLDIPHGFTWKGVYIDADLRRIETVTSAQGTDDRVRTFMKLSSLQGSILENRIFEDDFQVQSISTAKLIAVANGSQLPIITIDKANIDSVLPALPFDQSIKDDIVNSVNQNLSIKIPGQELSYENWTGMGFIKENQTTGESGWMLSGSIAGGMTVWSNDRWPQYYYDRLVNPYSEPANYDPASAKFIHKITTTDFPTEFVGAQLTHPLQVIVHTDQMQPVGGVNVTFTVKAGGGSLSGTAAGGSPVNGTTITVPTNATGIASVFLTLGQKTSSNPTFWYYSSTDTTRPYPDQVGENLVDAALPSGTRISTPFAAYGFPKAARTMKSLHGDGLASTILFLSGFVSVGLEDEYGNPISNLPVKIEALAPETTPESLKCNPDTTKNAYLMSTIEPCLSSAPIWGACGLVNQQTLTFYTHSRGAQAEVMLGGVPYAVYPIKATCTDPQKCINTATNELLHVDFKHYTYNSNCGTELHMQSLYLTDSYGNNINAGKTGAQIPVMAKLYSIVNSAVTTTFDSVTVTFDGQPGTAQTNGMFTGIHTLTSGINWIDARANATINSTPHTASISIPVYGVNITLTPPTLISLDHFGYAKADTVIPFSITPTEYTATTAYMVIMKNGVAIEYIPVETHGQGTATIGRGFWFDINSTYDVQVLLNTGTDVKIESDKVRLKIVQLNIVKPASSKNILIKNASNGDPKMEPLNAQVEIKSSGINPAIDVNSQKICWKFKVEYLVDTKAAPQRARKGLDPSGAGNGTDGFLIPQYPLPPEPGQMDCINYTGSTFVIDDAGSNGSTWNTNFGGGVLTITAKTVMQGVEVSDTYTGELEGEKTTNAFRTQMITYLKTAATTSTPENPSLETELGSPDILFALACVETKVNHFWPSIYGQPEGAIYPRENKSGDGGFGIMQLTEWGNPLKRPSYEQIWNWKKNVDAGIEVVKEKINDQYNGASGYPERLRQRKPKIKTLINDFAPEELRKDVYSLFRGGHYWRIDYDMVSKSYKWRPRFNKDSDDEDEVQDYIDSGVSEADKAILNEGKNVCQ